MGKQIKTQFWSSVALKPDTFRTYSVLTRELFEFSALFFLVTDVADTAA
jgi:hypothetical protein